MKTDNLPVEIIEGVFIGSIGAAMNKKALEENKITHIIVAAQGIKEYHPEVKSYITIIKIFFQVKKYNFFTNSLILKGF